MAAVASFIDFLQETDFLFLETKLILSTLAIIYVGSHASLRRPPSAARDKDGKPGSDDEDEERNVPQGLEPTDAILFPVLAACVLMGLYHAFQWMQDPDIINTLVRNYIATISVASLVNLYSHAMDLATGFVFPRYWTGRDGRLRAVDQQTRSVKLCDAVGNPSPGAHDSLNPFPGFLRFLGPSEGLRRTAWSIRDMLKRRWVVKVFVHGFGRKEGKFKFSHIVAIFLALGTAILYSYTSSTLLANILGYGMCYGSFQVISPTDYITGTLLLGGLFVYDIIMVFYTPFMVTVATKLDAPIKLTFTTAGRSSILGLGDIVIPGILIAMALRFDLYLHYLDKIKYQAENLKLVEKHPSSETLSVRSEQKHREVKAKYVNVKGHWGDYLWIRENIFARARIMPPALEKTIFKKTYFYSALIGYLVGMIATVTSLIITQRGQPALLFLVPGVLGSIWLTAVTRGDLKAMYAYTEDGSIDTVDVVVDLDGDGRPIKQIGECKDGVVDTTGSPHEGGHKRSEERHAEKSSDHTVLSITIEAPDDEVERL